MFGVFFLVSGGMLGLILYLFITITLAP